MYTKRVYAERSHRFRGLEHRHWFAFGWNRLSALFTFEQNGLGITLLFVLKLLFSCKRALVVKTCHAMKKLIPSFENRNKRC